MSEDLVYFGEVKVDKNKKEDFDLSNKIVYYGSVNSGRVVEEEDVREAVRLLKERLRVKNYTQEWVDLDDIIEGIDKIFGELADG